MRERPEGEETPSSEDALYLRPYTLRRRRRRRRLSSRGMCGIEAVNFRGGHTGARVAFHSNSPTRSLSSLQTFSS
jgi:hypothetical protein